MVSVYCAYLFSTYSESDSEEEFSLSELILEESVSLVSFGTVSVTCTTCTSETSLFWLINFLLFFARNISSIVFLDFFSSSFYFNLLWHRFQWPTNNWMKVKRWLTWVFFKIMILLLNYSECIRHENPQSLFQLIYNKAAHMR